MLTIEEARATLRVDGSSNDIIIQPLIDSMQSYILLTVGYYLPEDELTKTLEKFLLQLWYNPDGTDSDRLRIVIDNLIKTLKCNYPAVSE